MISSLLISLFVTLLAELSFALLLGLRDRRSLLVVALVNVITNPVVVFLLNLQVLYGVLLPKVPLTVLLELAAFFTEALIYKVTLQGKPNPFVLALLLNTASFLLGAVINLF